MKRIITILVILIQVSMVSAQLKVAILEPVDKAQNVNYGVKLLLRSSLTSAISNTPGYEGYDRVDMASITGEQEFQRTGNVSDNQIKQIGIATGAAYVLVTEAAKYDEKSIIITAKILDVETFGVKRSSVEVSGVTVDEMAESCRKLAATLLGVEVYPAINNQNKINSNSTKAEPTDMILLTTLSNGNLVYVAKEDEPKELNYDEAAESCNCKGEGWRLPTREELKLISKNKSKIGGISIWLKYWGEESDRGMDMGIGKMTIILKSAKLKVRCVKEIKK